MKAILVIDMPEECLACPMLNGNDECIVQDDDSNFAAETFENLRIGCPLRPFPEKKDVTAPGAESYVSGWNDCIDAIDPEN